MNTSCRRFARAVVQCVAAALTLSMLQGGVCAAQAPAASASETHQSTDGEPWVDPNPPTSEWYGWQTLVADVVALGVTGGGLYIVSKGAGNPIGWPFVAVGLIGYATVTPLLHYSQHNSWWLPSLIMRGAAVALTVAGTVYLGHCMGEDTSCSDALLLPLFLSGPLLAAVSTTLDAVFAVDRPKSSSLTWAPWADPHTVAAGLNVGGRW